MLTYVLKPMHDSFLKNEKLEVFKGQDIGTDIGLASKSDSHSKIPSKGEY